MQFLTDIWNALRGKKTIVGGIGILTLVVLMVFGVDMTEDPDTIISPWAWVAFISLVGVGLVDKLKRIEKLLVSIWPVIRELFADDDDDDDDDD